MSLSVLNQLDNEFAVFMVVVHDDVAKLPRVQIVEAERAFFAGVWVAIQMLNRCTGGARAHDELRHELTEACLQFTTLVEEGKR